MRTRLTYALSVALAAATLTAQGTQQPIFRAGTNLVRVDMYATEDGRAVEGLTRDDVEVLEDGVRQSLETFEHVRVSRAGSDDARVEPNTVAGSRQMAADPRARVFVIFLDTYHTRIEGSAAMRQPLAGFLDRVLGPDDLVAVMTPEMAATDLAFGRKTTVISNIMQDNWAWGRRGRTADDDPKDALYDTCFAGSGPAIAREMKDRRREKATLDALGDLVVHLNGLREERKAVLTVSEGWLLYRESRLLARSGADDRDAGRPPRPPDVFTRGRSRPGEGGAVTGVSRTECDADRQALASLDHSMRLREIAEEANRGNVSFYPVSAAGLTTFDASLGAERPPTRADDAANLRTRQDALRFLAENTDGLAVVGTNRIEAAIARIVDDLSSYYLLGYHSSNPKLDGRFRTITVRVTRPGVQVRARHGYRGLTADELLGGGRSSGSGGAATASEALSAVTGARARAPFRIRASAWTRPSGAPGEAGSFWVVGELDYATRRELAWTAGAKAEVTVLAADGRQVVSATLAVPSSQGSFALHVPDAGGVASGEYAVRVQVRPNGDETLAVSDSARVVVPKAPGALGEAVLWRRGTSTGPQFLRTADPRYRRSDRLRLELATATPGASTARLLDRAGRTLPVPVQVGERLDETGGFRWIVAELALAPLAMGDYGVEVTQGGATQVTAFRMVP